MKRVLLSFTAIVMISLLAACNQDNNTNDDQENTVTPVETVEAVEDDLTIEKSVYGRTAPGSATPIIVQSPGEIDSLVVENGDKVEEDDLIAKIKTPAGKQSIYASKSGKIVNLKAEEGSIASSEEPLAVIADMKKMKLNFTVTSNVRALFEKEDKRPVLIGDKKYEAEITSISTMPDDTGLYPVEATVENKDEEILPGTVVVLYVPEKRINETIIVPTEAVFEESDQTFIYIVEDNQAVKKEVKVKEVQSDVTAVDGEVKKGDQVVVKGQLLLSDKSKVDVVKEGNKS